MTMTIFTLILRSWTYPVRAQWDTTQRRFTTTSIEGNYNESDIH